MPEITTNKRIVKGAFVTYRSVVEKWDGTTQEVSRSADRGDEIELVPQEEARLDHLGMLMPKGAPRTDLRTLEQKLQDDAKRARQIEQLDDDTKAQLEAAQAGDPDLPNVTDTFNAAAATDEEIAAWISEAKPNADETVAAAGDDAALAQRILDAETVARAGTPRQAVAKALKAIASSTEGDAADAGGDTGEE